MPRADVIADRVGKKRLSEKIKVGFI